MTKKNVITPRPRRDDEESDLARIQEAVDEAFASNADVQLPPEIHTLNKGLMLRGGVRITGGKL